MTLTQLIQRIRAAWPHVPPPPPRIRRWTYTDADGQLQVLRSPDEAPVGETLEPLVRLAFPKHWAEVTTEELGKADIGPYTVPERHFLLPRWLVEAIENPSDRVLYDVACFLDLELFAARTPDASRAWLAELTLEQCACIEAVWEATRELNRAPAVRRGRIWLASAPAPSNAGEWYDTLTDATAGVKRLLTEIQAAFDGVPPPTGTSLFAAEAADHADSDRRPGHTGRWQDVGDDDLLACQNALPWLDDDGRRYYVPPMMGLVLQTVPDVVDGFPRPGELDGWLWHDLTWIGLDPAPFDSAQRAAIAKFMRVHLGDDATLDRWRG